MMPSTVYNNTQRWSTAYSDVVKTFHFKTKTVSAVAGSRQGQDRGNLICNRCEARLKQSRDLKTEETEAEFTTRQTAQY